VHGHDERNRVCPRCNGSGVDPLLPGWLDMLSGDWADSQCPQCNGTGRVSG